VPPAKLKVHNIDFFSTTDEETTQWYREYYGESWSWYVLADYENGNFFTIDLDPKRLGRCYDSNHELHPIESYMVAASFDDFLKRILANPEAPEDGGEAEFENLGNPYENLQRPIQRSLTSG
jgi:hypothetical protein